LEFKMGFWKEFIRRSYEGLFGEEIKALNDKVTDLEAKLKVYQNTNKKIEVPKITGQITHSEVAGLLAPLTNNLNISDLKFSTCSKEEAEKFSEKSMVQTAKYVTEHHDCENFSYALNGYWSDSLYSFPFGIAWSSNHAFNIFISDDRQVWIVEPQTNKYYTLEEAKTKSSPDGVSYTPIRLILI